MSLCIKRFVGRPIIGGWHWQIPGGPMVGSEKGSDSDAVSELVDKVTEYRVCNGIPPGDPLSEITAYYALMYPWTVEDCDSPDSEDRDELVGSVYAWINSLWKSPPHEFAQPDEIERRTAACLGCPWRANPPPDTSRAGIEASRRVLLLTRGNPCPDETGTCRFHEWDNRLACMLPKDKLVVDECPKECYLKLDKLG